MIKWHSVDEYPNTSQVIVIDNNNRIKIAGVKKGDKAPYDWISLEELFKEIDAMQYVIDCFSEWETDGCPEQCVYASDVLKAITSKEIDGIVRSGIDSMIKNTSVEIEGHKCSDFCGMKGRECECWAEQYRKEFFSKN